ncbi:MAG: patatin-like phospholipase family protein [Pseudomonadota bacterium]
MSVDSIIEKAILQESDLFKDKNEKVFKSLLKISSPITLEKNAALFNYGDTADALYILVHGRLASISKNAEISAIIKPGELVGEIGVFANSSHMLTIKALRRSKLLKIDGPTFLKLCETNPDLLKEVNQLLINRLRSTLQLIEHKEVKRRCSCIITSSSKIDYQHFFTALNLSLDNSKTLIVAQSQFLKEETNSKLKVEQLFNSLEDEYENLIYIAHPTSDQYWWNACINNADKLYILVDTQKQKIYDPLLKKKLEYETSDVVERNLILLREHARQNIKGSQRWIENYACKNHYHVALDDTASIKRFMRFLLDIQVSLTISGGLFRGWAAIGMLKALYENDIPIDIIGGTSIGAVVAAAHIFCENDYDNLYEFFNKIYTAEERPFRFHRYTIPITSFLSSANGTLALKKLFKSKTIEDLPLNFFCVGFNLTQAQPHIFRNGLLWLALRATSALPVLIPPVEINSELIVDGAINNNFPIDIMHTILENTGLYIGIDLGNCRGIPEKYHFPPILKPLNLLLYKLGLKHYTLPKLNKVLHDSLFANTTIASRKNAKLANVLIRPDLTEYNQLALERAKVRDLIELGYACAMENLEKHSNLLDNNIVR